MSYAADPPPDVPVWCLDCRRYVLQSNPEHEGHRFTVSHPKPPRRRQPTPRPIPFRIARAIKLADVEPRGWCVDCQRLVPKSEWLDHDHHQMFATHPMGNNGAAPIGQEGTEPKITRYVSGLDGWDRVLGGGLVKGTRLLLTGDPGAGKSTIVLLVLWLLARLGLMVLYLTAEESREEIRLRFAGMGLPISPRLIVYATKSWESAVYAIDKYKPRVIVLDSLQEFETVATPGEAGDDRQIMALMRLSAGVMERRWHPTFIIIGHVNAAGVSYGRVAAVHKVTAHAHFSKDSLGRRMLRMRKNRHGKVPSVSVWEFPSDGKLIREVTDVSELLLRDSLGRCGVVAYPAMPSETIERLTVVPIEAAVSPPKALNDMRVRTQQGMPEKALEDALDRLGDCGFKFHNRSVRLQAPTLGEMNLADGGSVLATCVALVVSFERMSLPAVGAFGTLAANGRVQPDAHIEERLLALHAAKATLVFGPPRGEARVPAGMEYHAVTDLADLVEQLRTRATLVLVRAGDTPDNDRL